MSNVFINMIVFYKKWTPGTLYWPLFLHVSNETKNPPFQLTIFKVCTRFTTAILMAPGNGHIIRSNVKICTGRYYHVLKWSQMLEFHYEILRS